MKQYNTDKEAIDAFVEKFNEGIGIYQIHKQDTVTYTAEDGDEIFNPDVDFDHSAADVLNEIVG